MRDHPCQPLTGYVAIDDAERIDRVTAFRALMAGRRTVRDFSDRPVPRAVVEQAILTAGSAPSGANHQPWFFSVIESADARARIRQAAEAEEREFYATKAPAGMAGRPGAAGHRSRQGLPGDGTRPDRHLRPEAGRTEPRRRPQELLCPGERRHRHGPADRGPAFGRDRRP